MRIKRCLGMFAVMACVCMMAVFSKDAKAAKLSVTTDSASGTVNVSVSDGQIAGAEASVICFSPSWTGSYDVADSAVVYLGQKKAGVSSVSFKINKAVQAGNYTLIMSAGSKEEVKFAFNSGGNSVNTPAPPEAKVTKPKAPKIKTKVKGRKVTVSWKKIKGAKGYKIYMSNKKKGKYKIKATIKKAKTVKWTKKLKKGTYYVKVKAYKKVSGKIVYSKFSNVKKIVIKKK